MTPRKEHIVLSKLSVDGDRLLTLATESVSPGFDGLTVDYRYPDSHGLGRTLALGVFDGVHIGHRLLIDKVTETAAATGTVPAIMTFSPHPAEIISPGNAPELLTDITTRARLILGAGAGEVIVKNFNPELRALTASEFLSLLAEKYKVRHLVVGFNHRFGSDRIASIDDYRRLAAPFEITVEQAPEIELPDLDLPVSSSSVRDYLRSGRPESAAEMLGRPYSLSGTVVAGRGVGRKFGFPTANLQPCCPGLLIPASGVYACIAVTDSGEFPDDVTGRHPAVVNIGTRPTFGPSDAATVEAHLIGVDRDLYGCRLTLEFISRLRDERRFDSPEALRRQIERDKALAATKLAPFLY